MNLDEVRAVVISVDKAAEIAAGILYPFIGMLLKLMIAGAAMALPSMTVVSNANRLRVRKSGGEIGGLLLITLIVWWFWIARR